MADRNTVKAAIREHEKKLRQNPDVVGLGVKEEGGEAGLAVYVSSRGSEADIPKKLTVHLGEGSDSVDVHIVEVGKIAPR